MEIVVARLGVPVAVVTGCANGCVVRFEDRTAGMDIAGRLAPVDAAQTYTASWADRYEACASAGEVVLIDTLDKRRIRIELDPSGYASLASCCVSAGRLWIGGDSRVTSVSTDALEALFASKDRTVQITARTVYPLRKPGAAQPARVAWVFESGEALVNIGTQQIRLPSTGLTKSTDIVLRDELYRGTWALAETPGGARVELVNVDAVTAFEARVVRSKVMAPREPAPVETIASTDPRLEQLVAELARDPDNDANRVVLVDLLQELGSAFGKWVAEGGADKQRKRRRDALGPLAPYLDDVVYRGGLPCTAKVRYRAPLEEDVLAAAAADLRLGMLSILRIGSGPPAVYQRLVGSPRAIGLRGVDLATRGIADALIARGYTALTHVFDVRFTKRDILARLADPTFAGVTEIETVVQRQHFAGLLRRLREDEYGLFQRPRRLVITEQHGHALELVAGLGVFHELACSELRVGAMTLRKTPDGVHVTVASDASSPWYVERLAAVLPELAALEVADEQTRRAARTWYPTLMAR